MALPYNPERSMQLLDQQKAAVLSAEKRKGQKPAAKASRAQLEDWYTPKNAPPNREKGQFVLSQTVVGFAYPPSTASLTKLEPIDNSALRLETHHSGKVLIARIFGHALRVQSVQNGIEDRHGSADRLTLYNADPDVSPQEILPRGGVFAIKEPYYKLANDGGPCVRIDHPSDLVRLKVTDGLMPEKWRPLASPASRSAADFKRTGNEAFKARDYGVAASHYTHGIDACAETDRDLKCDLLRNRAMAYIHLKRYEQAKADAEASLLPESGEMVINAKSYYRAALASYELRDYHEARKCFGAARKRNAADPATEREYKRTIARALQCWQCSWRDQVDDAFD